MPTYEYKCKDCGHQFETLQGINAKPIAKCPECHGRLKRLIGSGAGIIFKGSGFYATDYAKKDKKPEVSTCPGAKDNSSCKACPKAKE